MLNAAVVATLEVFVFDFLKRSYKNEQRSVKFMNFSPKVGMTRSDGIVALGGGVVCDLAGFAASTYMRGIHFDTDELDGSGRFFLIGGKTESTMP